MKRLFTATVIILFIAVFTVSAYAAEYPLPTGHFSDFAETFSQNQAGKLNTRLIDFEKKSNVQIEVVTVQDTGEESFEDYTRNLIKNWEVENLNPNNYIIFLVDAKGKKAFIEKASLVKPRLTDIAASRIINSIVMPYLKAGDTKSAVLRGTEAIIEEIDSSTTQSFNMTAFTSKNGGLVIFSLVIFVLFVSFIGFINLLNRRNPD